MADVYVLPGIERRDLNGTRTRLEDVLAGAAEAGLTDAMVVGRDRKGELYIASTDVDCDRDVGLLMRAVSYISSARVEGGVIASEDDGGTG